MKLIIRKAVKAAERVDSSLWVGEDRAAYFEKVARSVILAIRDPNEDMAHAGFTAMLQCDGESSPFTHPRAAWQSMIDEALK